MFIRVYFLLGLVGVHCFEYLQKGDVVLPAKLDHFIQVADAGYVHSELLS